MLPFALLVAFAEAKEKEYLVRKAAQAGNENLLIAKGVACPEYIDDVHDARLAGADRDLCPQAGRRCLPHRAADSHRHSLVLGLVWVQARPFASYARGHEDLR